jgi:PPK2 family polyphosphate:nucleotide phosphotransferase
MERYRVEPKEDFRLSRLDPGETFGVDEAEACRILDGNRERIAELQNRLYAESERSLLIVLQSMDTGGKDPIIRDVLNRANSQACKVTAFKRASKEHKKQDRLRRFHLAMPDKGEIAVFNRAYYDDIVGNHAHGEASEERLETVYRQIREFERMLHEEQIEIIKLYLHLSKAEQKRRLEERISDPTRQWELSEADFRERQYWEGYMAAYERAIRDTNTEWAPWYVLPADNRWFRDAAASEVIARALERMDPQFPPPEVDLSKVKLED